MEDGVTDLAIERLGLLEPEREGSCPHKVIRSNDAKRQTQQENRCLCVFEFDQLRHDPISDSKEGIFDKLLSKRSRTKRNTQHLDFIRWGDRNSSNRTFQITLGVEPRPLTLLRVQLETHRRTTFRQNLPHLQQQLLVSNNSTVIHVPLLVHWIQPRNLINEGLKATTKVKRTQGVALLNPTLREKLVGVIIH